MCTCWSGPTPISTGGLAAISPKHANYPCLLMFFGSLATQQICNVVIIVKFLMKFIHY